MRILLLLVPALFCTALPVAAQSPARSQAAAAVCETGRISDIFIDNHSVFDTTDPDLNPRFDWAYGIANALHFRTDASVIRRELLFSVGDCYDPFLVEESARLLRGMEFLARVDVYGVRQPDGSYHVVVDTRDEWSTVVDVKVTLDDGLRFEGAELVETNLFGTGRRIGVFYAERDVTQSYGISYGTPQFLGTRWDVGISAGRTRAGTFFSQQIAYPFVGEVGRWAAHEGFARDDRFFDYIAQPTDSGTTHVLLPLRDKSFDVAVVRRIGEPGSLTLFGGAITYQKLFYPGGPDAIEVFYGNDYDEGAGSADSALTAPVRARTRPVNSVRLVLVVGQQNIHWVRRRGFDSMRGEQDIRLGADVQLAVGRSLPMLGEADDMLATLTLYGGIEVGNTLLAGRLRADGRHNFDAGADVPAWEDLLAEAEVLGYWDPAFLPDHTLVFRAAGAGGWHTRTPFQLTLGGEHALRGYDNERFPGARRIVFSLEDRIYFGWPFADVLDLGGTVFVDVGRIWPGDVPFGVDSSWRASAGLGLRGAFPAGSRTTYRLDFAMPLHAGAGLDDIRLIISVGELFGITTGFSDYQMQRSRQMTLSGGLFHFPD